MAHGPVWASALPLLLVSAAARSKCEWWVSSWWHFISELTQSWKWAGRGRGTRPQATWDCCEEVRWKIIRLKIFSFAQHPWLKKLTHAFIVVDSFTDQSWELSQHKETMRTESELVSCDTFVVMADVSASGEVEDYSCSYSEKMKILILKGDIWKELR